MPGIAKNKAAKRAKHPSPGASDSTVDLTHLLDIVAAFSRQTICVVGDFVLDEFVSGEISRVSREAPVLILRHCHSELYPGGGANAVNNLVDLGARVLPVGAVGADENGRTLLEYFRRKAVDVSGIVRAREWVTTTKTRYLAGWTHTKEQQVLRVDREPRTSFPAAAQESVGRKSHRVAPRADAVLISDYGLGSATPELVRNLKCKCPITLDSRYRILDYRDCGIAAATPNEAELEVAYQDHIGTDVLKLEHLGQRMLQNLAVESLLVTRGKDGMALFQRRPRSSANAEEHVAPAHIAIYGSDVPVDVTGAGDTVIAVFTLALSAGASHLEAAHLANYAGGIVVSKRRTATISRQELESALRGEATAQS